MIRASTTNETTALSVPVREVASDAQIRDRARLGFITLASVAFCAWIIARPIGGLAFSGATNLACVLMVLVGATWCLSGFWKASRMVRAGRLHRDGLKSAFPLLLIGVGQIAFCVATAIWVYYEWYLKVEVPYPSIADAFYIAEYPVCLAGILLLPSRPIPPALRGRVILDGAMTLCALFTFSWYFLLGPAIMGGAESLLEQIVSIGYPVGDLLLFFCLLVIMAHEHAPESRAGVRFMAVGLLLVVGADILYGYYELAGTYETGAFFEPGWPVGYLLMALGAARIVAPSRDALAQPATLAEPAVPGIWKSLLPYAFVPPLGLLVLYTIAADSTLKAGVVAGFTTLILLVLSRQMLTMAENGRLTRTLQNTYHDLTHKNRALEALVATDSMTGLANHGAFQQRLREEVARSARTGRPLSLLMIDVDFFKQYNDQFGHPAGDEVIKRVAQLIRASIRNEEIPARYGGEEFAVLLTEANADAAAEVAERIRTLIAGYPLPGRTITVSIGLASAAGEGIDAAALIARADSALYSAKRSGRNCIRQAGSPGAESHFEIPRTVGERQWEGLEAYGDNPAIPMLKGVLAALDLRDCETGDHSHRVARYALRIADELERIASYKLSPQERRELETGALLHDIGKIGVPDSILLKAGVLTEDEWEVIRRHPVQGVELLSGFPQLAPAIPVVLNHHERWDGSGYPYGLSGADIPLSARIFAVADTLDAMSSDRPYRKAAPFDAIRREIAAAAGTQFDVDVVNAFLAIDSSEWQPASIES